MTGQQQMFAMKEIFMKNSAVFGTTDREQSLNIEAIRSEASILESLQVRWRCRPGSTLPVRRCTEQCFQSAACGMGGCFHEMYE